MLESFPGVETSTPSAEALAPVEVFQPHPASLKVEENTPAYPSEGPNFQRFTFAAPDRAIVDNQKLTSVNQDTAQEGVMRFILAAFMAFGVTDPQDAIAGAWLREEGKGFASVSATVDAEKQAMTTTYLEYGWTSQTTLGAKLETESTGMRGTGLVFMVKPVGDKSRPARMSWNIGIGATWSEVSISPLLRVGLSWGRGISFVNRDGWLTFDASVEWDTVSAQTTTKLDSTVGFALTEQSKAMLQVFFTQSMDGGSMKIAPSWLYKPQGRNFTYQLGAELPASGSEEPKIKIGFWRDF